MSWLVPKIWDGSDVWIIGGGPSIPKQFSVPDDIIQKVTAGTLPPNTYSDYLEPIHDKHVIGINCSYMLGDWIDIVFFGDKDFFLKYKEPLSKHPALKVTCSTGLEKYKFIKVLNRDVKHSKGISNYPDAVSWNHNSGAAAISLAVHLGATRIILLGFDMKLGSNNYQHWHNVYGKGPVQPNDKRRNMQLPFDRHLRGFPIIAEEAKKLGVEILNACPESAIECFPKYTVKQLLWDNS